MKPLWSKANPFFYWIPQEIKCSHKITPWKEYGRQESVHIEKIKRYTTYNWHKLEEDLIKNDQTTPITVSKLAKCKCGITKEHKYQVRNGEHRCFILYKLYGDDHIVDAYK